MSYATCLPSPGNGVEALSCKHAHFQRKRLEYKSVKQRRVLKERAWIYGCVYGYTLPRDGLNQTHLLVLRNF